MEQKEAELVYLAGLFDGEGSFSIQVSIKNKSGRDSVWFNPRMTCNMKNSLPVLELLQTHFGGTLYESTTRDGMCMWVLSKKEHLVPAVNALLPNLRIKRRIAERFIEALSYFPTSRKAHRLGERSWTEEQTLKVAEIALTLNPATARRSEKTIQYVESLRAMYAKDGADAH